MNQPTASDASSIASPPAGCFAEASKPAPWRPPAVAAPGWSSPGRDTPGAPGSPHSRRHSPCHRASAPPSPRRHRRATPGCCQGPARYAEAPSAQELPARSAQPPAFPPLHGGRRPPGQSIRPPVPIASSGALPARRSRCRRHRRPAPPHRRSAAAPPPDRTAAWRAAGLHGRRRHEFPSNLPETRAGHRPLCLPADRRSRQSPSPAHR